MRRSSRGRRFGGFVDVVVDVVAGVVVYYSLCVFHWEVRLKNVCKLKR